MDIDHYQEPPHESASQGIWAALLAEAPWNAKSVIAAGLQPSEASPHGQLIGHRPLWQASGAATWQVFYRLGLRRFLRMAALLTGAVLARIAVLEETGWIISTGLPWRRRSTTPSQPRTGS